MSIFREGDVIHLSQYNVYCDAQIKKIFTLKFAMTQLNQT